MDLFKGYLVSSVSNALNDVGTAVDFIPGGLTSKLQVFLYMFIYLFYSLILFQVLDGGINKPFKAGTRSGFEHFLRHRQSFVAKPQRLDVAN